MFVNHALKSSRSHLIGHWKVSPFINWTQQKKQDPMKTFLPLTDTAGTSAGATVSALASRRAAGGFRER